MPPRGCLPSPGPNVVGWVGTCGLKGGSLRWCGRAAPARVLPGESTSPLCSWCLWSWHCFGCLVLRLLSGSPPLPCLVWPWRAAPTARAQVKGYKGVPLLLYTDRSPWAWATHKRDTLLGQAQNGELAGGADFITVTVPSAALPHDPRWTRDVGVSRACVTEARWRHLAVDSKEAACVSP